MFNNAMMKQAKKMQEKMKVAQEEIAKMETEGSSGGIKVKLIGAKPLRKSKFQISCLNKVTNHFLKNFLKDAVNDATNKADKITQKKMKKVTGGIKIPGLF
ncbi:MAG: nucleoid-associated protein, YbaB/EbfC family [Gammaproteobacteria bacterium]|nr:MAG: nucleoid-associated protein, YbaB/EbfC family [Gammaproteobacteria bacterium]